MLLKKIENTYLEEYDVSVKPYLTYSEIQNIINAAKQYNVWAFRQQCIDMMVLLYATNIGEETINKTGHDALYTSGLIDAVMLEIENVRCIYEGLGFEESLTNMLAQFPKDIEKLNSIAQQVKKTKEGKKDANGKK